MSRPVSVNSAKVAVITGGAAGIGRAFADRLAAQGITVVIADLRDAAAAANEIASAGHRALGVDVDVSNEEAVQGMVDITVAKYGRLDFLINNAALFSTLTPGPFTDISASQWQQVMNVNTLGPFLTARAAVPIMRRGGGGAIVNIASNTVHKGAPGLLHYVSSKGAVIAFTRALARELGADGITVNAIAPGFTLSDGVLQNERYQGSFRTGALEARAIRRDQSPADLVGAVAFLISDDARFMTGQTLVVDGGNVFV
jgi:NAD(P)-dependent dehydrogenase (short-subunit alcohol dehydrogenase family)